MTEAETWQTGVIYEKRRKGRRETGCRERERRSVTHVCGLEGRVEQ